MISSRLSLNDEHDSDSGTESGLGSARRLKQGLGGRAVQHRIPLGAGELAQRSPITMTRPGDPFVDISTSRRSLVSVTKASTTTTHRSIDVQELRSRCFGTLIPVSKTLRQEEGAMLNIPSALPL